MSIIKIWTQKRTLVEGRSHDERDIVDAFEHSP